MSGVIVDIGTGDGEFVYSVAKEYPDRFVIGIDPHHKGLEKTSARTYRKPAKGGVGNALYVLSNVESLPEEMNGIANQVFINFPWAGLLKGIVLAEDATWNPIKRICKKGAFVDILFGYDQDYEENELERLNLPALSTSYIKNVMSPKLEEQGLKVVEIRSVAGKELRDYPSSWAKKLSFGRNREYYYLRLQTE
ncbi:MAG: hypothetical protein JSW16_03540 [Dehalococcoidales bacterium]|nr:MAG: hypothetical protein JSW16_03540 [Dehalococcoidales bacterium]